MRRTSLLLLLCALVISIAASSCATGYSKKTYISSLEKFVSQVEEKCNKYDDDDWAKVDERMEAFEEKYEKYSDDFTTEELKELAKIKGRYALVRAKSAGKSLMEGIKNLFEDNKAVIEGYMESLEDLDSSIEEYVDSIKSLFK